jgi:hypothetical protein
MQPSRPNRNGHPISTAFRFRSWTEVSHAKARAPSSDGSRRVNYSRAPDDDSSLIEAVAVGAGGCGNAVQRERLKVAALAWTWQRFGYFF